MKKIRSLLVRFDHELPTWKVSAFRGAVIEKVGRENILFNHHIDDRKYLYQYPLIQYKSIYRKPALLCLGDGVDEVHKLFNKSSWEIDLQGDKLNLVIDKLDLGNFTLNIWDKLFRYSLHSWLGLNATNYKKYQETTGEIEKLEILEKILVGNIISLAKGLGWDIDSEIKLRVHEIIKTKQVKYKNTRLLAFDLSFSTNAFLPSYIGLGKGVSHGFGVVRGITANK